MIFVDECSVRGYFSSTSFSSQKHAVLSVIIPNADAFTPLFNSLQCTVPKYISTRSSHPSGTKYTYTVIELIRSATKPP